MARIVEVDIGNGQMARITRPDRLDFDENLGGAVAFQLANALTWIAETTGDNLGRLFGSALVGFLETIEPHLVEIYSPLIDQIRLAGDLPEWFSTFLDGLENPEHEASAAVAQAVLGSAAGAVTGGLLSTPLSPVIYGLNDFFRPARPGPADALTMWWRNEINDSTLDDWLSDQGWPAIAIDAFKETVRPRPAPNDLLAMIWRYQEDVSAFSQELVKRGFSDQEAERLVEIIRPRVDMDTLLGYTYRQQAGETEARAELEKRGYLPEDIDKYFEMWRPRPAIANLFDWAWRVHQDPEAVRPELLKRGYLPDDVDKLQELAKFIPSIGDLISMAVREAFTPDAIAKYGLGDKWPQVFGDWAEKRGVPEEWAKRYWYAHWVLPSPTMGFEMLHRKEIDKDELRDLLTYADIVPWWIEKLINISYTPYTRVDIRRMYDLGVLSPGELVEAHEDIGYSREKAEKMADFVKSLYIESDVEKTKVEVLAAYRSGMYSPAEAQGFLIALGKTPDYAGFLLSLEDFKREQALIAEHLRQIKTLFVNGELDRGGASAKLSALDLAAERITRLLDEWQITKDAKVARPSKAMIKDYYKQGIISDPVARVELDKRRYPDYVIAWMIRDWDQEIAEAASKEAERLQKEEERIVKAEFKTNRQVAIAHLSVEIATLKLAIAELKLAEYETGESEQYAAIRERMGELWEAYFVAETDEERDAIEAEMDRLAEQQGLLDAVIITINRDILIAKRDIAGLQLQKAQLPVVPEI